MSPLHTKRPSIFARENSLWAAPFDVDRLELTGDPIRVLEAVRVHPGTGLAQFAVAANGSLVYVPTGVAPSGSTLVWVDRRGDTIAVEAHRKTYGERPRRATTPSLNEFGRRFSTGTSSRKSAERPCTSIRSCKRRIMS